MIDKKKAPPAKQKKPRGEQLLDRRQEPERPGSVG
jgi:hypothetical protein